MVINTWLHTKWMCNQIDCQINPFFIMTDLVTSLSMSITVAFMFTKFSFPTIFTSSLFFSQFYLPSPKFWKFKVLASDSIFLIGFTIFLCFIATISSIIHIFVSSYFFTKFRFHLLYLLGFVCVFSHFRFCNISSKFIYLFVYFF